MSELRHTDFMKGLTGLLKEQLPREHLGFHLGETKWYYQLYYGKERNIHYEVNRPAARCGRMLEIGLHFELRNPHLNASLLHEFTRYILEIREALGDQVVAESWDRGWSKVYEAYPGEILTPELQAFSVERMVAFITAIQPLYLFIAKGLKL